MSSIAPSNWDIPTWKCMGIGIHRQTATTYDSYSCCGKYHRDEKSVSCACCCYYFWKENDNYYSYYTPLACGQNHSSEDYWHCWPVRYSRKVFGHNSTSIYHCCVVGTGDVNRDSICWLGPLGSVCNHDNV